MGYSPNYFDCKIERAVDEQGAPVARVTVYGERIPRAYESGERASNKAMRVRWCYHTGVDSEVVDFAPADEPDVLAFVLEGAELRRVWSIIQVLSCDCHGLLIEIQGEIYPLMPGNLFSLWLEEQGFSFESISEDSSSDERHEQA